MDQNKTVLPSLTEIPIKKEFETALDEAQAWAKSVGYKEEDVNDIIKATRLRRQRRSSTGKDRDNQGNQTTTSFTCG